MDESIESIENIERIESIELHDDWIKHHEERLSKLLIRDPWSDPMVHKVGLYDMYIIDAIVESLEVTVEEDANVRLGCMNPVYKLLFKHITEAIKERESFKNLVDFAEKLLKRKVRIVKWTNYKPDIRILDSADECLSWLFSRYD